MTQKLRFLLEAVTNGRTMRVVVVGLPLLLILGSCQTREPVPQYEVTAT
jgi:hypothetical protein